MVHHRLGREGLKDKTEEGKSVDQGVGRHRLGREGLTNKMEEGASNDLGREGLIDKMEEGGLNNLGREEGLTDKMEEGSDAMATKSGVGRLREYCDFRDPGEHGSQDDRDFWEGWREGEGEGEEGENDSYEEECGGVAMAAQTVETTVSLTPSTPVVQSTGHLQSRTPAKSKRMGF